MADTQIVPLGDVNAPADWVLPSHAQFQLASAFAHFDGTGAAGSFIPTLQVISDSGHTVFEAPQDVTVAAGSSVEASWAQGFRGAASAASSLSWAFYVTRSNTITVANVDTPIRQAVTGPFFTNDATAFDLGSVVISGTTYQGVRLLKDGVYVLFAGFVVQNLSAGDSFNFYYVQGGGDTQGFFGGTDQYFVDAADPTHFNGGWIEAYQVSSPVAPAPTDPQIFSSKQSPGTGSHTIATTMYLYLGPGQIFV